MKRTLTFLLALLPVVTATSAEIHVRPDGPIRTLAEAQRAARKDKAHVVVHSGTYYLPEMLVFTSEDSGTEYRASEGEKVVISGGTLNADRQTEEGYDEVTCPLPAVISVTAGVVEPRYPSFKGIMAAKSKPIDTLTTGDVRRFEEVEAACCGWWFPTLDRDAGAALHFAVDHGQVRRERGSLDV